MQWRTKSEKTDFCITQFERFLRGIRDWSCDEVSYAEIHAASLFLCEDDEFEKILRRRWSSARPTQTLPADATPLDFAVDVAPDLVSGFFEALIEYMETEKGKICGGESA
jgi:hypothetical protein